MNFFKNQFVIAVLFALVVIFLVQIRDILILLFIAFILTSAFRPIVEFLNRYRIPRAVGALIVYIVVFATLTILIVPIVPFFISQLDSFINRFPDYLEKANNALGIKINAEQIQTYLKENIGTISTNAYSVVSKFFGGMFAFLSIIVVSFYLMITQQSFEKTVVNLFPKAYEEKILTILRRSEKSLGAWFRGQLLLSVSIGIVTWIALTLLQLEFALPLAILAGLLEILPTIGPILAAIPAVIVALSVSPTTAILTIVAYIVIQAMENNFFVPKIMENAVGLNPVLIILSIMIGAQLMGIIGALIAIPFTSFLIIIFHTFRPPRE